MVVKRRIERTTRGSSTSMNTRYKVESTMYGTMRRSMLGAVNETRGSGPVKANMQSLTDCRTIKI